MKIIKPYHKHISKKGLTPYQFIEKIGRTCYKSEDKITEESAVKFVQGLCKRKHYAMIEHYWVHIKYTGSYPRNFYNSLDNFATVDCLRLGGSSDILKYVQITEAKDLFISAPLRVFFDMVSILENVPFDTDYIDSNVDGMLSCVGNYFPEIFPQCFSYRKTRDFKIVPEDAFCVELAEQIATNPAFDPGIREYVLYQELMKHKTHTVLFVCDRGVSHELVRHRPCSFAQESTRYCNYSQNKFDGEITFIKPCFWEDDSKEMKLWRTSCDFSESKYFDLLLSGATPQQARDVLPNSLKTEIIMTANEKEWQHIVDLRAKEVTGPVHPQMKEIMCPWHSELVTLSEGRIKL